MYEFDWILSRTSSSELFATFARTKLHPVVPPPLKLVRMLLCQAAQRVSRSAATRVCSSIVRGSKYQTDAHALSWYKLVTYLGVGCCVIYTASGPSALGCVNHAAPYILVCNLYLYNNCIHNDQNAQHTYI